MVNVLHSKYKKILESSKNLKSKFVFDYDIYKSTWFRTGGKTDIFCLVNDENELEIILENIENVPYFIIGAGSNLLIRDGGYKGIIVKLGKSFNNLSIREDKIFAGASILDTNIAKFALLNSIKDLEFFSGIPGTIGGAIKMNAGCFGSETKDVLKEFSIFKRNGERKTLTNKEIDFSYRNSNLSDNDIVTSVKLKAEIGEKNEIESKIKEIKLIRETSQPIKTKTGGSTFKNPKGRFAAKLIELADCKGLTFGDAAVSTKHSNFLVNLGKATAKDIETLGKIIQEKVMKKLNIFLEWEIKIIGENFD